MKPLAYLLAAAGLLVACKPASETKTVAASLIEQPAPIVATAAKEREISGTVFITTREGYDVKLSAVKVEVVEWKAASAHLNEAREAAHGLAEKENARVRATLAEWAIANTNLTKVMDALNNAQRNTAKFTPAQQEALLAPFLQRASLALAEMNRCKEKAESQSEKRQWFDRWAESGEKAFDQPWPGVLQTVTTDAVGAFKVSVPNDREVVLVAKAKRIEGRDIEELCWCVTVAKSDKGPVHLSTANLLNSTP